MKSIRETLRDIIEHRILPWVERDGISKLILPEQIPPADCTRAPGCSRRPRHRYHDPAIGIGLAGKSPYCIENKAFVLTPGKMLFLPGGTSFQLFQTSLRFPKYLDPDRPSSTLWFRGYPSGAWAQFGRVTDAGDVLELTKPNLLLGRHFGRLLTCLLEEVRSHQPYYARVGQDILLEFMHRCLRASVLSAAVNIPVAATRRRSAKTAHKRSRKADSKQLPNCVRVAQEFIRYHYQIPISLDHIADASETSDSHLRRQFKAATGITPIQYLQEVRMEAARQLLLTELKISEVAILVGFEDPFYFSRVFRQSNGVGPRQYRRKMAKTAKRSATHASSAKSRKAE
jgi:AraC-like DNA-binding protein